MVRVPSTTLSRVSLSTIDALDPVPESIIEETVKDDAENDEATKEQFDPSLPPELRKLMEQAKQREKEIAAATAAAAAAAAQAEKERTALEQSNTHLISEATEHENEVDAVALDRNNSLKNDDVSMGRVNI